MDIFPTAMRAAGADLASYEVDGQSLLPYLTQGDVLPQRDLMWEMGKQTAIRRDDWKLVLGGQLVEGAPPEDDIHLAHLGNDMGETVNLRHEDPRRTQDLKEAAESWRAGIEERWEQEFLHEDRSTSSRPRPVTHA